MDKWSKVEVEFAEFMLNVKGLTVLEMKFVIWHYFNKLPYRELAELDDKTWSRQYSQQIVKEAIKKLRQV